MSFVGIVIALYLFGTFCIMLGMKIEHYIISAPYMDEPEPTTEPIPAVIEQEDV